MADRMEAYKKGKFWLLSFLQHQFIDMDTVSDRHGVVPTAGYGVPLFGLSVMGPVARDLCATTADICTNATRSFHHGQKTFSTTIGHSTRFPCDHKGDDKMTWSFVDCHHALHHLSDGEVWVFSVRWVAGGDLLFFRIPHIYCSISQRGVFLGRSYGRY